MMTVNTNGSPWSWTENAALVNRHCVYDMLGKQY